VLSQRAWQDWYAAQPSVIGRTLALDGTHYTVVGVMPAWFDYPTGADFWIPFVPGSGAADRASHYVSAVARLDPRTSVEDERAELRAIARRLAQAYPASDAGWQFRATPIHDFLMGDTRSRAALAAAAAIVGRVMASVLYGVTHAHVPTLLLAGGIMVSIGALASWGPAERAAGISPASALRSE
jgi:uncharacterized MAPEG superfamily protein